MVVLVSGASGHVGSAIASHLIDLGCEVVGLSRSLKAAKGFAQQIQIDLCEASFVAKVNSVLPYCDVIVHAAATLDKDLTAPVVSLTNCLGMQHMLALAEQWRVKSFIYISGVPVIGTPQVLPITEDHTTAPLSAYHASKLYGEQLLSIAVRAGLIGCSLRLTSPVGPGMPSNRIFSAFVTRARANQPLILAGRGSRCQNYVDVRDVAVAVEQCLGQAVSGLYNIAGAGFISNLDLARACVETLGSSSSIAFSGQPDSEEGLVWDVSVARAWERFGYIPKYDTAASIRAVDVSLHPR